MASGASESLTYHSATLYPSDIRLFTPPSWLNDHCLVFHSEYMKHSLCRGDASKCFVHAGVVFMAIHEKDPAILADSLAALDLPSRAMVFMPVNDNPFASAAGGSHWSLLVYHRGDNAFRHYDSAGSAAHRALAAAISENLAPVLKSAPGAGFESAPCAKQVNGFDCGAYTACFTEGLAGVDGAPAPDKLAPDAVTARRYQLAKIAHDLAEASKASKVDAAPGGRTGGGGGGGGDA